MKRILSLLVLFLLLIVVGNDSYFHFDSAFVEAKQRHQSSQRHWSLFYAQNHVFRDGSLSYQKDLTAMREHIDAGSLLLSDKATSYHAAAVLPVYINNVHNHHGRWMRLHWKSFIDQRHFCYQEFEENREKVRKHLAKYSDLDYVIVNRDRNISHRKLDCMAFRSDTLTAELPKYAELLFKGVNLDLYRLNSSDNEGSTTTSP